MTMLTRNNMLTIRTKIFRSEIFGDHKHQSQFWHNVECWHSVDIMLTPFSYHLDRRLTCWHKLTHTHTHCCHNFTMTRPGEGEAAWMRATKSIFQLLKVLVCLFVFYFATSGLVLVVVYVVFVSFSVTDL